MAEYVMTLSNRPRSAKVHMCGVHRMVEDEACLIDIIQQVQIIQKALDKISELISGRHLQTCVTTAIQGDDVDECQRVIREIMQSFDVTQGK